MGLALHRVLPDQIYWAQTLLAFSLFATIMFAPPTGRSSALIAAGLTGLIFGWTFLTGEGGRLVSSGMRARNWRSRFAGPT